MARMPLLTALLSALANALAAAGTAGSALPGFFNGGWLGGIPGAAALLLFQVGDSGGQGSDLVGKNLVLLSDLLVLPNHLQQQVTDTVRCRFPASVGDATGRAHHHRLYQSQISAYSWFRSRADPQLANWPPLNAYEGGGGRDTRLRPKIFL
jgi:hypothetical protein